MDRTDRVSVALDGTPVPSLGTLEIKDENSTAGQNDFLKWNLRVWVEPSFDRVIQDQFPGGISPQFFARPMHALDFDETCPTPGSCGSPDQIVHSSPAQMTIDYDLLHTFGTAAMNTCDLGEVVSLVAHYSIDGDFQLANGAVRATGLAQYFGVKQPRNAAFNDDPCDASLGDLVHSEMFGPVEIPAVSGTTIFLGPTVVQFPRFTGNRVECPGGRCFSARQYETEAAVLAAEISCSVAP